MSGRYIHLTPLGGIAGDMFAAAMLDALPALRAPVLDAVAAVLPGGGHGRLEPAISGGLSGSRFVVAPPADRAPRHYPDLAAMIAAAPLPAGTREHAGVMLRRLAEAEAAVHGIAPEKVHFHEIADWDTLADLVAAGRILDALGDAVWTLDPLPLGGGLVRTQHGPLPVPAPATARMLTGLPVHDDGIGGERVTPTGAAIAAHLHGLGAAAATPAAGLLAATGYGAGTRDLPGLANVLVVRIVEAQPDAPEGDTVCTLEFDVDDMTGEEIAVAADRLRALDGTLDLTTVALQGKKGRPATGFRLLTRPACADAVAEACFAQTSTIGLRLRTERRRLLPRAAEHGAPRVKQVTRPGGAHTRKAESDDLAGATLAERRALARRAEQ
ncbi:nickel pincer cofactor biosynthesis protein LarC [Halovulum marinum]|uniref:LarC family nickel insertion protein n=1 Tax=Halovulum marinum TaxID=2662447 RepID=UPI002D79C699|nr:LarC family nickel insertion protein [Halovulum marinum]